LAQRLKPGEVIQQVSCRRAADRLAQPGQDGLPGSLSQVQKRLNFTFLRFAKGSGKPSIQTTLRPNDDFRAQPLQDRNCRENDFGFPERFDQRLG
jgi:hypothetical protein